MLQNNKSRRWTSCLLALGLVIFFYITRTEGSIIAVSTSDDLATILANAVDGDSILLQPGLYSPSSTAVLSGAKTLSLTAIGVGGSVVGQGTHVVACPSFGASAAFSAVGSGLLSLQGITFTNCQTSVVLVSGGASLTVDGVFFANNSVQGLGAAVNFQSPSGTLLVKNSRFSRHTAMSGAAVFVDGAVKVTVDGDTVMEDCIAFHGSGGCMYVANVQNVSISLRQASNSLSIPVSATAGCWRAFTNHSGACFFVANVTTSVVIAGGYYTETNASIFGGVIAVVSHPRPTSPQALTVLIDAVTASNVSSGCGGGSLFVSSSDFFVSQQAINCVASSETLVVRGLQGQLFPQSSNVSVALTVRNSVFNSSYASNIPNGCGGAVLVAMPARVSVSFSSFSRNNALRYGGALAVFPLSSVAVNASFFFQNNPVSHEMDVFNFALDNSGGAVYVGPGSEMSVFDSSFSLNGGRAAGGALFLGDNSTLIVRDSQFYANILHVFGVMFTDISARGGTIFAGANCAVVLHNNTMVGGFASSSGGHLFLDELSNLTVSASHFSYGQASLVGGGSLAVDNADTVIIQNSAFEHCSCTANGGCMYFNQIRILQLDNVNFSDSSSTPMGHALVPYGGGAIFLQAFSATSVKISRSSFYRNNARRSQGGSIYMRVFRDAVSVPSSSLVSLEDCVFGGSMADFQGGALYLDSNSDVQIVRSSFIKNHAYPNQFSTTGDGGAAAFNSGRHVHLINCTFSQNRARNRGGAVTVGSLVANFSVSNSSFDDNSIGTPNGLSLNGAALAISGGSVVMYGVAFRYNRIFENDVSSVDRAVTFASRSSFHAVSALSSDMTWDVRDTYVIPCYQGFAPDSLQMSLSVCLECSLPAIEYGKLCSLCPATIAADASGLIGAACSGHGQCLASIIGNGTCVCSSGSGWYGTACQFSCPRNPTSGSVCSNRGTCITNVWANDSYCFCNDEFEGASCQLVKVPSGLPPTGPIGDIGMGIGGTAAVSSVFSGSASSLTMLMLMIERVVRVFQVNAAFPAWYTYTMHNLGLEFRSLVPWAPNLGIYDFEPVNEEANVYHDSVFVHYERTVVHSYSEAFLANAADAINSFVFTLLLAVGAAVAIELSWLLIFRSLGVSHLAIESQVENVMMVIFWGALLSPFYSLVVASWIPLSVGNYPGRPAAAAVVTFYGIVLSLLLGAFLHWWHRWIVVAFKDHATAIIDTAVSGDEAASTRTAPTGPAECIQKPDGASLLKEKEAVKKRSKALMLWHVTAKSVMFHQEKRRQARSLSGDDEALLSPSSSDAMTSQQVIGVKRRTVGLVNERLEEGAAQEAAYEEGGRWKSLGFRLIFSCGYSLVAGLRAGTHMIIPLQLFKAMLDSLIIAVAQDSPNAQLSGLIILQLLQSTAMLFMRPFHEWHEKLVIIVTDVSDLVQLFLVVGIQNTSSTDARENMSWFLFYLQICTILVVYVFVFVSFLYNLYEMFVHVRDRFSRRRARQAKAASRSSSGVSQSRKAMRMGAEDQQSFDMISPSNSEAAFGSPFLSGRNMSLSITPRLTPLNSRGETVADPLSADFLTASSQIQLLMSRREWVSGVKKQILSAWWQQICDELGVTRSPIEHGLLEKATFDRAVMSAPHTQGSLQQVTAQSDDPVVEQRDLGPLSNGLSMTSMELINFPEPRNEIERRRCILARMIRYRFYQLLVHPNTSDVVRSHDSSFSQSFSSASMLSVPPSQRVPRKPISDRDHSTTSSSATSTNSSGQGSDRNAPMRNNPPPARSIPPFNPLVVSVPPSSSSGPAPLIQHDD